MKSKVSVRLDRVFVNELRMKFPDVPITSIFKMCYQTSTLKLGPEMANMFGKKNRKGSLDDVYGIMTMIGISAFVILIVYVFMKQFITGASPSLSLMPGGGNAITALTRTVAAGPGIFDNMVLWMAIIVGIIALALASQLPTNGGFIAIFSIGIVVVASMAYFLSILWTRLTTTGPLSPYAPDLVYSNFLMTYLPYVVGMLGLMMLFVIFKNKGGPQQAYG